MAARHADSLCRYLEHWVYRGALWHAQFASVCVSLVAFRFFNPVLSALDLFSQSAVAE